MAEDRGFLQNDTSQRRLRGSDQPRHRNSYSCFLCQDGAGSQDVVDQVNQEIKDGQKDKRAKEYFDSAVERYELLKGENDANDGDYSSSSNRRRNVRLGDRLLQKGKYYNTPSLYVKAQRADRFGLLEDTSDEEENTAFRVYKSKDGKETRYTQLLLQFDAEQTTNDRSGTNILQREGDTYSSC